MIIKLKKAIAEQIGLEEFKRFGIGEKAWSWKEIADLSLARLSPAMLAQLRALLVKGEKIRGVGLMIKDVDTWIAAQKDATSVKPRKPEQFHALVIKYLAKVGGHRVYRRHEDGVDLCMYVNEIKFVERHESRDGVTPAHTIICLMWEEFGGTKGKREVFWEEDWRAMTVVEALARRQLLPETPELRAAYLVEAERFGATAKAIGKQFLAVGTGTDDLDGNPGGDDDRHYFRRTHRVQLLREGEPTRVVIDVFYEDDKTSRNERDREHVNSWFWRHQEDDRPDIVADEEDGDATDELEATEEIPVIEVPIHPFVAAFDLSKHLRLRIHVNNLTEYVYDRKLADRLVLAEELKLLVEMLIEHKDGGFRDIVKGKTGGAVVLLAGPPGVGKTLTAEVYAESEARALYSVQCSQLGTNAAELEDALLKVFARARRWSAVLLLDEADVYVHERGNDMQQNAIVGVFLRVLEYQNSVMFLTTNRPKDVDDAIASRCIARLTYKVPSVEEQARIWRILADGSGARISDETIATVVKANPILSGRDVKNLLKLSIMVSRRAKADISFEVVEFVKRFKPTASIVVEP